MITEMPVQPNQDWLTCQICYNTYTDKKHQPLSLGCGHVVCKSCMVNLDTGKCPLDQSPLPISVHHIPVNNALLLVMGYEPLRSEEMNLEWRTLIGSDNLQQYEAIMGCMDNMGDYLMGWIKGECGDDYGIDNSPLTKPMQRKLLTLFSCQVAEVEGRARACRCARSIGERVVSELILHHQQHQQLSAYLWAAVRARGCQFLGPAMQEEVLKLILTALKSGESMSRKVLVLHVVQHLERQFPHASKTAIGHVVQLLYRASCFKVTKRDDQSSLMQLKEEFCTYEYLRREHDSQIVQIASEAGLRIAPEQWSSLLYGDAVHKSHMQSIIDKLQSPQSFSQSINELLIVLQRNGDPCALSSLRPHLDLLAAIDAGYEAPTPSWDDLSSAVQAIWSIIQKFAEFIQINQKKPLDLAATNQTKFKTSMCRDFSQRGACPRGNSCTFAHSVEEMERFRARSRRARTQVRFGQGALDLTPEIVTGSDLIPPNITNQSAAAITNRVSSGASTITSDVTQSGISTVTSLVSSNSGTIATSTILPPSTAAFQNLIASTSAPYRLAFTTAAVVASMTGKSTNTTSESRYGQHRKQQAVVRVGNSYQESQFSGEHLDISDRYQPSLPSQAFPPPQQYDHNDLQDATRQRKVIHAQMGSQPLVSAQQNPSAGFKVSESLPSLQLRNQSLLTNLYRRREELLSNLGPSAPSGSALTRTTMSTSGHGCSGCHVNGLRCCASAYRGPESRLPSNVMTPGIQSSHGTHLAFSSLPDRMLNRTRAFTPEELCRSVSDSAVSMQATARVDKVMELKSESGSSPSLGYRVRLDEDDDWAPFAAAATLAESDSDFEEGDISDSQDSNYWTLDPAPVSTAEETSDEMNNLRIDEPDVLWLPRGDDEEIPFVPFDPPFVSKYGPISRAARMKVSKNTAPRVMDALRHSGPTPVTAVTPSSRPHPTAFQTASPAQPHSWTRHPLGMAIANSLPTANIKVEQMVGTSPGNCSEPHTLWSLRQAELESEGVLLNGRHRSIAEREQLKHELDLLDQQIQMVSHDEQLARHLQQLDTSLQNAEPMVGRCVAQQQVVVMALPSTQIVSPAVASLPPRYGAPRAPPFPTGLTCANGVSRGFNGMFADVTQP